MDIKDFLPELRRMIQGPLQKLMVDELMASTIVFCKNAKVIQERLSVGDVDKEASIDISTSTPGLSTWGTIAVYSQGDKLSRDIDYTQSSRGVIKFLSNTNDVSVIIFLVPDGKASLIPDSLDDYATSICHGAAAELYLQPNRSWTDGDRQNYHTRYFIEGYRSAWREMSSNEFGVFQNPEVKNSVWY